MSGRGGQGCFERSRYSTEPKYLSLKPHPLHFTHTILTKNPFYLLSGSTGCEKNYISIPPFSSTSFVSINPSKSDPPTSLSTNAHKTDNGKPTTSCIDNPQNAQAAQNSSRNAFQQFYAHQKKLSLEKIKRYKTNCEIILTLYGHKKLAQLHNSLLPNKVCLPLPPLPTPMSLISYRIL